MKKLLFIALCILLPLQGVVGSVLAQEPSDSLKEVYKVREVQFYAFNYPSRGADGEEVILSSLLIAWQPTAPNETDSIESLHIYSHYTTTADKECPTSDSNNTDRMLFSALVKKSYGVGLGNDFNFISRCVVIAPDYEGFGVSKGRNHPYLSQELTAEQVLDAVTYGLKLYGKHIADARALPFKNNWRSFAYGYSQGGAVTLAVHRYIEEKGLSDELRFRGSICGDGPYDLLTTLKYYIEDDGKSYDTETAHVRGTSTLPVVMPMIIQGMLESDPGMKGHKLEDYLSQQFLDTGIMEWLASKEFSTGDISKKWYKQLQEGLDANGQHYSPEQMAELFYSPSKNEVWGRLEKLFTPEFYEYMLHWEDASMVWDEAMTDIHRAMMRNSLCEGWEPWHRIQFVHSRADTVVPFGNYLAFRDAHVEGEGDLFRIDESLSPNDHGAAGSQFFVNLCATGGYGETFKWLDEGDYTTGIMAMDDGRWTTENGQKTWYTIDGRRLNGRPTAKGLYILGGKKVFLK